MKNTISLIWVVCTILFCSNQSYGQEEKYHQINFGSYYSSEQVKDYSFGQALPKTNYNKIFDNLLEIQADFKMAYIWIYNDTGFEIFDQIDTNYVTFSLPSGHYNVFVGYAPQINRHTFIINENIDVTTNSQLKIFQQDALYTNLYSFNKINSDTLNISTITFYFFNQLDVNNLRIRHLNIDSNVFTLKHNSLPTHFDGEWVVKGKPFYNNNDIYLLNNQLIFYETDTTITNEVINLAYADIDFFLPDSILHSSGKQIFTFIPDYHWSGSGDLSYTHPLIQKIYQDTSADIGLRSSKFWQTVFCNQLGFLNSLYIHTSELRFKNGKVMGYHYRDSIAPSYIISDTSYVQLGQPPAF